MRMSPKAGLLVSSAVCGALTLGIAGPAAYAAVGDAPAARPASAPAVPVPGADKLASQAKLLGDAGGVLKPVTDLVNAVLKAPDGKLPAADATKLADPVKAALAKVTEAAPAAPAAPGIPGGATGVSGAPAAPDPGAALKAKAAADLQAKVDALVKAVTTGKPTEVAAAVQAVLTAQVNVLVAILLGGGLPAANLPGLPALPTVPGVAQLPATPGA
ncbi:hypothetical protein OG372_22640 [Streptomyces sp. NBC_01020]|uniref:hypothetical protein n=1 Tax=unclassified Streptomyces TaxID=2593676 RepID=UPI002E23E7C4|nr:hypothetical protein OG372_22640 [Streptomyces sp. NBC_01020]WSX67740.1 hypothetical protein OG221_14500 [Streptomyces sp. NBC_00932]